MHVFVPEDTGGTNELDCVRWCRSAGYIPEGDLSKSAGKPIRGIEYCGRAIAGHRGGAGAERGGVLGGVLGTVARVNEHCTGVGEESRNLIGVSSMRAVVTNT